MAQPYSGSALHLACSDGDLDKVEQLLSNTNVANEHINKLVYDDSFGSEIAPLHLAVEGGFREICEVLLKNGASTELLDGEAYTPLHIACNVGNNETVKLLIDYGADPECIHEGSGATSLQEAVCSGSLPVVQTLLSRIKSNDFVNVKDHKGWSPLHFACHYGHTAIAECLLQHSAHSNDKIKIGRTALHLAAFEGFVECTKVLLEHSADVNIQDEEGWTAVILASQEGHPAVVKAICEFNPDLTLRSKTGRNAIHAACFHGHIHCIKIILDAADCSALVTVSDKDGWSPLHLAAQEGNLDIVAHLVSLNYVDMNPRALNGRTPLHNAVLKGRLEVAQFLIESGATIDIQDSKSWTPLHVACQHGYLKIAKLLAEHRAGINDTIDSGRNSLHLAAFEGHAEVATFLLERGIDYCLRDKDDWSPLHLAVQEGHESIVMILMDQPKIEVNTRAKNKRIPLHSSCYHGRAKIAELLLAKGSDWTIQDEKGWTPLHLCAQEGHLDIVMTLVLLGADVNIRADNKRAPIHLACMKGQHARPAACCPIPVRARCGHHHARYAPVDAPLHLLPPQPLGRSSVPHQPRS